jgi:type IV secretory pathway TraG/TraD family ATPase VirD4
MHIDIWCEAMLMLFEYAESLPKKELPLLVHLICDDFATGCKIPDFNEYISVFCAKKISVNLLLQSESQLTCMYGKEELFRKYRAEP